MDHVLNSSAGRLELTFKALTDAQRRLAQSISQGKTDQDIAAELRMNEQELYPQIMELYRALGVEGDNYAQRREGIKKAGIQFFGGNLGEETEAAEVLAPAPKHIQSGDAEGPAARGTRTEASESLPEIEVLAARIGRLADIPRRRLRVIVFSEKGERAKVAKEMGLSEASIVPTMTLIYKRLGVSNIKSGRKELLQKAFRHLERQELIGRIREDPEVETPAQAPAAPTLIVPAPPQPEAPAALRLEPPSEAPPPAPANGFGAGVVIPIPADTASVEVLSGEFSRRDPSASLGADPRAQAAGSNARVPRAVPVGH